MIAKVLEPAKKELDAHGDITFEYSFQKIKSRSYNTLNIKIFSRNAPKTKDNTSEWYSFVYRFLCITFPNYESDKAQRLTDQLQQAGKIRSAYSKFIKLEDEFTKGKKTHVDLIKLTKHILKDDFNLK